MKRQFFLATHLVPVLLGLMLLSASPSTAAVFNPETFTLKNGMQVVVVNNPRAPVITQMVWYKVGSADEAIGETGVAHLLEHLMFKGTKAFPDGEFSRILARNGGQENAFTSYDYTAYFQTVASDRLEMVMQMESDRMTGLVLNEDQIAPEIKVVLEERRSRVDNNPSSILREQMNAALFLNYPYRRPIIGWQQEVSSLKRDDIIRFYKRWYAPNNAILVVTGDITKKQLKPLAEKYYGVIKPSNNIRRNRPEEPDQKAERLVTLKDKRVRQPSWQRVYLSPSSNKARNEAALPLEILSNVLGGGGTSRLYRALVIDKKLALSAGSYYSGDNIGPNRFGVYATPRPGVTMEQIQTAIDAEIATAVTDIGEEEVDRARNRMTSQAIYARDSASAAANVLGQALAIGLKIDDVENWPENISAVTLNDVKNAARNVFKINRSVTGILLGKKPTTKDNNNG